MSIFHVLKYPVSASMSKDEWEALPATVRYRYNAWYNRQSAAVEEHECMAQIRQILANYEDEL